MRRATAVVVVVFVFVSACNGLTGVSAFEVLDNEVEPDADRRSSDAGEGAESGPVEVDPSDAGAGVDAASASDAAPTGDATTSCKSTKAGARYGTLAFGNGWSEPEGILSPNDNKVAHSNGVDNPITLGGFGFTIPASARIDGIELELRRNAVGVLNDEAIALPKGNPKSNGAWPQSDFGGPYVATTYGGPTDTWGASWTAADINANMFGVLVKVKGTGDGHADSLGVTVYYCE